MGHNNIKLIIYVTCIIYTTHITKPVIEAQPPRTEQYQQYNMIYFTITIYTLCITQINIRMHINP